ncbi:hypothetical protein Plhal304r1_c025g0084621 [Plasmopara halstedii]
MQFLLLGAIGLVIVGIRDFQAIFVKPVKVRYNYRYCSQLILMLRSIFGLAGSSIRNFNVRISWQQTFDISHDYDFDHLTNEIVKITSISDI